MPLTEPRKRGRPKGTTKPAASKRVSRSITLPAAAWARIDAYARDRHLRSASRVVETFLEAVAPQT